MEEEEEKEILKSHVADFLVIENFRTATSFPEGLNQAMFMMLVDTKHVGSGKESILQLVTNVAGAHRIRDDLEAWCKNNPI